MDLRGAYSNTDAQVRHLEDLLRKLPKLDALLRQPSKRPKPGRARQLENEQVQKLIAEYQAGATVYQLGERFGISRQTVGKILKRQGVTMRMQGLTPEQIEEAVRLYEGGWSLARIGTKLKVDAGTVHARLRERGVRMRDTHGRPQ